MDTPFTPILIVGITLFIHRIVIAILQIIDRRIVSFLFGQINCKELILHILFLFGGYVSIISHVISCDRFVNVIFIDCLVHAISFLSRIFNLLLFYIYVLVLKFFTVTTLFLWLSNANDLL